MPDEIRDRYASLRNISPRRKSGLGRGAAAYRRHREFSAGAANRFYSLRAIVRPAGWLPTYPFGLCKYVQLVQKRGYSPGCMGTIEYTRYNYLHIWDGLLDVDGLQIACLGSEEGIEFSVNQLTAETFPWQDRCLVIGAVRSPAGWVLKRGPNYFPAEYIDRVLQSGLNARLRGPGRIFPRSHRKWCQAMMMLPAPIFAECRFVSSLEAMRFSHSIAASLSLSVFQDPGGHRSPFQSNRLAVVSVLAFIKADSDWVR